ncbi:MAG: YigZ family protein [Lachnospiraceae bacterium]|nr:YigZ family protein [Lachnospiraceae bacterium]
MATEKIVVLGEAQAELTEKKSRFIAAICEVHSEQEALAYIEQKRKQYWDARHNCFAFVVGENNEIQRFSDDKEPSGTAGKPILEVLLTSNLRNCVIVVTRYFGGVLLGTGGLVRAYGGVAQAAVKELFEGRSGKALKVCDGTRLSITSDYSLSGKIQYIISQMDIALEDTVYADNVCFKVAVEDSVKDSFIKKITEATNACASVTVLDSIRFVSDNGNIIPYEF